MDDRGQAILLAALAVCVCLILLAMYLISIEDAEAAEKPWAGRESLENVIWAQEEGLAHVAGVTGDYSWGQRHELANDFMSSAGPAIDSISRNMLAHGIAFSFEYNDTLATEYAAGSRETAMMAVGGVLIKKSDNAARVCGCAYDVSITDESARYSLSRVVCWS